MVQRLWFAASVFILTLSSSQGTDAFADEDISLPVHTSDKEGLEAYPVLPPILTLDDSVALFRKRGYDLIIADAAVLNAQGNLRSAQQFVNPTVNLVYGRAIGYHAEPPIGPGGGASPNYYSAGLNDNGALIDTLLVRKRFLRIDVAQAALDSAKYSRKDAERTLVSTVKQQWVAVAAAKKQLDINQDLLKSNQDTENLILVRFKSGAASQVDLSMQKTATYEAAQQVAYAQAAYVQAKAQLAFLLGERGRPPDFDVKPSLFDKQPGNEVLEATPQSLRKLAADHRPDVLAQKLQVTAAEASIRLTRRQIVPDFQLGVDYWQQGTGQNSVSPPTLSVNLTVNPPLFYQLQGELTMALANLRTQQATLAKALAQVANDIDTGYAAFQSAKDRLDRLNHGYLEESKRQYDLTYVQYDKGAASLVDLLVAQRTYVATVAEWVQSLNDFWTSIFMLEAAVAKEFQLGA